MPILLVIQSLSLLILGSLSLLPLFTPLLLPISHILFTFFFNKNKTFTHLHLILFCSNFFHFPREERKCQNFLSHHQTLPTPRKFTTACLVFFSLTCSSSVLSLFPTLSTSLTSFSSHRTLSRSFLSFLLSSSPPLFCFFLSSPLFSMTILHFNSPSKMS